MPRKGPQIIVCRLAAIVKAMWTVNLKKIAADVIVETVNLFHNHHLLGAHLTTCSIVLISTSSPPADRALFTWRVKDQLSSRHCRRGAGLLP